MPLAASEYAFDTHSLFAIEGGASSVDIDVTGPTDATVEDSAVANVGIKLGAQSENYRVFLSARYYDVQDIESLYTVGGEIQYLFNFSKYANFFIGGNIGEAFIQIKEDSGSAKSMYYGGDVGFNIHASKTFDIELGGRYMQLSETVTPVGSAYSYDFNYIATGYASLIIKWQMD